MLAPIFDHIESLVGGCIHISIYLMQGPDLTLRAYRGPIPPHEAEMMSLPVRNGGGATWVIENETPLLIPDVKVDSPQSRMFWRAAREFPGTFEYIRSWICLPLEFGGQVRGMIDVAHGTPGVYTEHHVQLFADYVREVAVHIENALLYSTLWQHSEETQSLLTVQQAISSHLDIEAVYRLVATQAQKLTSARQVWTFLSEGNQLRLVAAVGGTPASLRSAPQSLFSESLVEAALAQGTPIRIYDTLNDARLNPELWRPLGVRSLLLVPLVNESRTVGMLVATNKAFGSFGPSDERVVQMLAASAVIGIENARLYADERRRRQSAEIMQRILGQLSSNRPFEEVLSTILAYAGELMSTDQCAILSSLSGDAESPLRACRGLEPVCRDALELPAAWQVRQVLAAWRCMPVEDAPTHHIYDEETAGRRTSDRERMAAVIHLEEWAEQALATGAPAEMIASLERIAEKYTLAVIVPLVIQGEVSGCLEFYYPESRAFSNEELSTAETLGAHIALAMERYMLSERARTLVRVQERQRIAQTLHDTVVQMLFRVGLEARGCAEERATDDDVQERMRTIQRLAARGSYDLRSAIFALRHRELVGDNGLVELLEDQMTEYQTMTGIQATLIATPDIAPVPPLIAEAIFRIVREALSNTHKHADASAVLVSLNSKAGEISITIQDNGDGLDDLSAARPGERQNYTSACKPCNRSPPSLEDVS